MLLSKSHQYQRDFPSQDVLDYCVQQNEQAVVLVTGASVSALRIEGNDPELGTS